MSNYHPCTTILIQGLQNLPGGGEYIYQWDQARMKIDKQCILLDKILDNVPIEVIQAERTLSEYFKKNDIKDWKFGNCQSRKD